MAVHSKTIALFIALILLIQTTGFAQDGSSLDTDSAKACMTRKLGEWTAVNRQKNPTTKADQKFRSDFYRMMVQVFATVEELEDKGKAKAFMWTPALVMVLAIGYYAVEYQPELFYAFEFAGVFPNLKHTERFIRNLKITAQDLSQQLKQLPKEDSYYQVLKEKIANIRQARRTIIREMYRNTMITDAELVSSFRTQMENATGKYAKFFSKQSVFIAIGSIIVTLLCAASYKMLIKQTEEFVDATFSDLKNATSENDILDMIGSKNDQNIRKVRSAITSNCDDLDVAQLYDAIHSNNYREAAKAIYANRGRPLIQK